MNAADKKKTGLFGRVVAVGAYCIVLFLAFDFFYSRLFAEQTETAFRVADRDFHHGLVANFQGEALWGGRRYPFRTDSLGFKDHAVRDVTLHPSTKRVLLIGDSFTEGVGMTFAESYAGLLYEAGQRRTPPVEFLNAGVTTYSPVIYYRKIQHLLAIGLQFDEVVVFPDVSDIHDEATSYFCIDEDPAYRKFCTSRQGYDWDLARQYLRSFPITEATVLALWYRLVSGKPEDFGTPDTRLDQRIFDGGPTGRWTLKGFEPGQSFAPLGVDGGIERALKNMTRLSDLLASRSIPMTVVVYPWPGQLDKGDLESRQVALWRDFCVSRCKAFINLFPAVFAEKDAHADWYKRLFIPGDVHYSADGNRLLFGELESRLLPAQGAPRQGAPRQGAPRQGAP